MIHRPVGIAIGVLLALPCLTGCSGLPVGQGGTGGLADQRPDRLQPRRVGPAAMETWIAPWESASGDLYPGSTVYIAVAPERWEYVPEDGPTVLRPVQVEARIDDATRTTPPALPAIPTPGAAMPETPNLQLPSGIRRET